MNNNSKLTEKQWNFVNAFMANGRNGPEAARTTLDAKDKYAASYKILQNPKVKAEIAKREERLRRTIAQPEEEVLKRMWEEANREGKGAQHSARIAALVKYAEWCGYFKKEEDGDNGGLTISITNFSDGKKTVASTTAKAIKDATQEELEEASEIAGVEITSYE